MSIVVSFTARRVYYALLIKRAGFPPQPAWFENSTGYPGIAQGLAEVGFDEAEVAKICHGNWYQFFERSFGPEL